MCHCQGGPGTDTLDKMARSRSGSSREAPERIVASHLTNGKVDRTRPLCVPEGCEVERQRHTDDEASFSCVADSAARAEASAHDHGRREEGGHVSTNPVRLIAMGLLQARLGRDMRESRVGGLPDTRITSAAMVAPGAFTPPAAPGRGARAAEVPPPPVRLRGAGLLPRDGHAGPTGDSDIRIEVWLLTGELERQVQATGNGGWAGAIVSTRSPPP
jgi:hypothetical protein